METMLGTGKTTLPAPMARGLVKIAGSASALVIALIATATPVAAQDGRTQSAPTGQPTLPTSATNGVAPQANGDTQQTTVPAVDPTVAPSPALAMQTKLASFEKLSEKGWVTPYPSVADSIVRDAGGVRSALADAGFGVLGLSLNTFAYNILDNAPRRPNLYQGQRPTAYTNNVAVLTYDLGRVGDEGAQLIFSVAGNATTLKAFGPRGVRVSRLAIYQPLFGGKIAIKAGIFNQDQEFVGSTVGGSLVAGTLGPSAGIPFEVGLNRLNISSPAVNVRVDLSNGFYDKFGAQRSISPLGPDEEVRQNGSGLHFSVPGAKLLTINELGYKRDSAPGVKSTWLRVGGIHNNSKYLDYSTGRTDKKNWAIYAGFDRQLTAPDTTLPFRGLYAGATYQKAASKLNYVDSYYEARVYGLGIIPSRPFDLTSVVVNYSSYSNAARRSLLEGLATPTYGHSASITGSQAFHVSSGIYLTPGFTYTYHPAATAKYKDALNFLFGVNFIL